MIGKWAQYGLQWHFFGMWIFVLNGLAYLTYGIATGRFRQKLFPISMREILATVGDALRFRLAPRRSDASTTPCRKSSISASCWSAFSS